MSDMKQMKTLTIGDETYEIVDEQAREMVKNASQNVDLSGYLTEEKAKEFLEAMDIQTSINSTLYNSKEGGLQLKVLHGNTEQNGHTGECVGLQRGVYSATTGEYVADYNYVTGRVPIPCKSGDVIKVTHDTAIGFVVVYYNENGLVSYVTKYNKTEAEFTVPDGVTRFNIDFSFGETITLEGVGRCTLTVNDKYVMPITTHGKNLISYPYVHTTRTYGGTTVTDNGDGTLTVDGTATAAHYFSVNSAFTLPKGKYKLSGCPVGGGGASYCVLLRKNGVNTDKTAADYGNGAIFDVTDETAEYVIIICIYTGVVASGLAFMPMLCRCDEDGSVMGGDIYEPHTAHTEFVYLDAPLKKSDAVADSIMEQDGVWCVERNVDVEIPTLEVLNAESQKALNSLKTFEGVTYVDFDVLIQPSLFELKYGASEIGALALENENLRKLLELAHAEDVAVINNNLDQLSEQIVDYVFPETYGAVGDGTTDDSVAIQTAIDNAGNEKIVYLSKKNYKISTGLFVRTNYATFKCDGTLIYDGVGSAITLTNTLRCEVEIDTIYAENGTAIRLSNVDGQVKFSQISVNNIRSSKVGIHLTTPNTENRGVIYYNKISFMDIVASEIGINVTPIGDYINENRYFGGTIGGGCYYGIKIDGSITDYYTQANKFLSGGIEGIDDGGYGIYIENSEYNIFKNIRTLENYGKYLLCLKGKAQLNIFDLPRIKVSEIDITGLGEIGVSANIINVAKSTFDDSTLTGTRLEVTKKYGIVYDTKASTSPPFVDINLTNFPDYVIKPLNGLLSMSFRSTVNSLNGSTFVLDAIYYGYGSMLKGEPVVISFSETSGWIKITDVNGTTIIDNTSGKFGGKTIGIRWGGYDKIKSCNLWDVTVAGEYGMDGVGVLSVEQTIASTEDEGENVVTVTLTDGSITTFTVRNGSKGSQGEKGGTGANGEDGYTPVKGTDYYTEADKIEMVNAVLAALPMWIGGSY